MASFNCGISEVIQVQPILGGASLRPEVGAILKVWHDVCPALESHACGWARNLSVEEVFSLFTVVRLIISEAALTMEAALFPLVYG